MKLKPWLPASSSGLSQCVHPSWCHATDAAEAGLLDPHRLVERHEVVAVDRRRHGAAARGARTPAGTPAENCSDPSTISCTTRSGASRRRCRLGHLRRVPAVGRAGAADGSDSGLHPAEVALAAVGRRAPAARGGRAARPCVTGARSSMVDDVALDVVELLGAEHALEHVEAVLARRRRGSPGRAGRRASKRIGPRLPSAAARASPVAAVADHVRLGVAVVDDRDLEQRQLPHAGRYARSRPRHDRSAGGAGREPGDRCGRRQDLISRSIARVASLTIAVELSGVVGHGVARRSGGRAGRAGRRATLCSAFVTALTWVRMSMQYVSSSTIRCRPRTWPSMRRSRFT